MALRIGQILRGIKGTYHLIRPLKDSTIFKAKVLASPTIQEKWYHTLLLHYLSIISALNICQGRHQNCIHRQ
jgi:hypothetical protein